MKHLIGWRESGEKSNSIGLCEEWHLRYSGREQCDIIYKGLISKMGITKEEVQRWLLPKRRSNKCPG